MGWARGIVGAAAGALATWALLTWGCAARDLTPPPGAIGVRIGGDVAATRIVLDLDAASPGRVEVRDVGSRLIIEIPEAADASAGAGEGHGLVGTWALTPEAGGARMSLELASPATVRRRFLIPPSLEVAHWRYVVDLTATDPLADLADRVADEPPAPRSTPRPPPRPALAAEAMSPPAAASPRRPTLVASLPASPRLALIGPIGPRKVIVIDPGHGGHDTGAQSATHNEKDITLAAALALRSRLERSGRYRVVLTRTDDTFIPLPERVRISRQAHADLFISLHADSAGQDSAPHGASVYTVSDHGVTRVNEVVGPHDLFSKIGDRRADPAVSQILLDLSQRNTRNHSAEFANLIIDHIGQCVDVLPRGHRDASYYVLLAPDVPAVLMEMGFITNPGDETRLTDAEERRDLMDKVGDAIDDYFSPRRQIALR